jgi:hypothetical protein
MPYRPGLGLTLIIAGVILGAVGGFLTYRGYRTEGDRPFVATILLAVGATAFWTGIEMRRRDST